MAQVPSSVCNRCGREIIWMRNGIKWIPYNPGGSHHRCVAPYYGR
jgi:hypothetical protein